MGRPWLVTEALCLPTSAIDIDVMAFNVPGTMLQTFLVASRSVGPVHHGRQIYEAARHRDEKVTDLP